MLFKNWISSVILLSTAKSALAVPPPAFDFDLEVKGEGTPWSELSLENWDSAHDAESRAFMEKELSESGVTLNRTEPSDNKEGLRDKRAMCSNWWFKDNDRAYNGWTVQIRGYHALKFGCSQVRFPSDRMSFDSLLGEIVSRVTNSNHNSDVHMDLFGWWTLSMSANAHWNYNSLPPRLVNDMFGQTMKNEFRTYSGENGAYWSIWSTGDRARGVAPIQLYSFYLRPSDCGADVLDSWNIDGVWPC
ncbi:hypothetical protein NQ176_g507 [Zarea fungicola]|uniref:Uncharacterized protein n=1 Tax=Zarea fungicola TaxID=93591 RepID=A0ACC1NWI0_9HYPO|nr:hypothetical protein NQ176_g507 [Lecanicillium fungicola]